MSAQEDFDAAAASGMRPAGPLQPGFPPPPRSTLALRRRIRELEQQRRERDRRREREQWAVQRRERSRRPGTNKLGVYR